MPFFSQKQFDQLLHNNFDPLALDPGPVVHLYAYEQLVKHSWLLTKMISNDVYSAFGLHTETGCFSETGWLNLKELSHHHHENLYFDANFIPSHPLSLYALVANKDIRGLSINGWTKDELELLGLQSETKKIFHQNSNLVTEPIYLPFSIKEKPFASDKPHF